MGSERREGRAGPDLFFSGISGKKFDKVKKHGIVNFRISDEFGGCGRKKECSGGEMADALA